MRKKLLAGMLALALCSTNMPLQTIFAEEFTSGNPDVVFEEETPKIFTNEEQETAGETDEELSVFSSEEVPEFNDAPDEAMAAAENEQAGEIDLADNDKVINGVYTIRSAGDHKFTCSRETGNRIVVDGRNTSEQDNINIYLNKVNINTSTGPALRINVNVKATVTIYLTGTNNLIAKNTWYAGLQKANTASLIITTKVLDTTAGILNAHGSSDGDGAGIGGSNITINSCSVIASSKYGAGIGGNKQGAGSNITINSASVNARSTDGAGIGGGLYGAGSDIIINSSSVTASSTNGAGIGGGEGNSCKNITINNSSVTASSTNGAGIGGGKGGAGSNNITINGGSVKASSVSGSPTNAQEKVYCCTIENPENANVTIKTETGSSVWNWKPVNHSSLDPDDTNLYVWLPKLESNSTNSYLIILDPENSSESRTRNYSFDTVTNTFKAAQVVNDFIFKSPVNLIYDGQPKEASLEFKFKPTHENNRKISLVYYKGNYNDINENTQPLQGVPVNAGTYTVKAEIEASKSYFAHKGLVSPKWTFTIEKAPVAPGADPNETTISVPWSCKKISDITNPFSTDWNWDNDVKLDQELQVGTPITATAIYNGDDKGNYEKESITYTITRSQCTHEHTAGRYYSSPSCTSSGYSGDTYCTDCNETLSYGY
ncbi:carbohydrate-binding domain-containing protein, partial [Blautia wexlerae]|nr:carbohydrate-binding domain-containing protein [Blautia wexlerae]NSG02842.1 carbohydrate-binding domain-containing protein [Blautia wexlerae]